MPVASRLVAVWVGLALSLVSTVAVNWAYTREHAAAGRLPPLSARRPLASARALVGSWAWLAGSWAWLAGFAAECGGFVVYVFPATLTADIIDYDSLQTGFRREATYYQLHTFVEGTSTSLAPAFLAGLLVLGDTAADPLGIRLVAPAAAILIFAGYLVFHRYGLPDDVLDSAASSRA